MNEVKWQKKKVRLLLLGSIVSVTGAIIGGYHFLREKLDVMEYKLTYEPESFEVFNNLFNKYGCEDLVEFRQYLRENSTLRYDWIVLNDELKMVAIRDYNPHGQVAVDEYAAIQNHFNELVLQDPMTYLDISFSEILMIVGLPTIFVVLYLFQRYKYKVMCKEIVDEYQSNSA